MGMTPTLIFVIPPAVSPPPAGADSSPPPDGLPPPHAVNASTAASATAALIFFTGSLSITPECTDVPQVTHSIYVHSVRRQRSIRIVIITGFPAAAARRDPLSCRRCRTSA